MSFQTLINLLRVKQYYKNLLIFLPLIFVKELTNYDALTRVFIGFITLCLISSSNYILNDIFDRKKDKFHPENKSRPIASGKISPSLAFIFSLALILTALTLSVSLSFYFSLAIFSLFALTFLYSTLFKKILFLDIISISVNFVIRPLSGALIVYPDHIVRISPWLILVPFFLSLFLATAKRRSNNLVLKNKTYNPLIEKYDEKTTSFLFSTSTTLLIISYSLFSFYSDFPELIITIPIVLYAIFYYAKKVEEGSIIGRDVFQAFKDRNLILSMIIWTLTTIIIIYF